MELGSCHAAGWVGARSVLNVLSMLGNQSWTELRKLLSQLGYDFGANEVLYRCLVICITVDVYVELRECQLCGVVCPRGRADIQRTHVLPCHGRPRGL